MFISLFFILLGWDLSAIWHFGWFVSCWWFLWTEQVCILVHSSGTWDSESVIWGQHKEDCWVQYGKMFAILGGLVWDLGSFLTLNFINVAIVCVNRLKDFGSVIAIFLVLLLCLVQQICTFLKKEFVRYGRYIRSSLGLCFILLVLKFMSCSVLEGKLEVCLNVVYFALTHCVTFLKDSANCNGGKWIIRFKKAVSGRFWEDLVSEHMFLCPVSSVNKLLSWLWKILTLILLNNSSNLLL